VHLPPRHYSLTGLDLTLDVHPLPDTNL
jgi:hypothetical protein